MIVGKGIGEVFEPVENDLSGTPVLLVNPRLGVPTGPVFAGWDGVDRGPLPPGPASRIAREGRNDLRSSAIEQCPVIQDVLSSLAATDPWMCEMSGSGATCFALYEDVTKRDQAADALAQAHPDWWMMSGNLR